MNLKHHKIIQFTVLLMFLGASTHTCFAETNACGPSEDESLNDEAIQDIIAEETDSCDAPDVDAISIQETMENAYMQNTDLDAARAGIARHPQHFNDFVELREGERLVNDPEYALQRGGAHPVMMTGPAVTVFNAEIELPNNLTES